MRFFTRSVQRARKNHTGMPSTNYRVVLLQTAPFIQSNSPSFETGPRMCPAEKSWDSDPFSASSPFSAVRFVEEESRNTGMFRVFRR